MKISRNWLQTYFDSELPSAEQLADTLTFHVFEIEGVEKSGDDEVIDVDVLPNRSSDCLSHRGIAKELSVLLNVPLKSDPLRGPAPQWEGSRVLEVEVADAKLCRRFSALVIKGIKVGPSPDWLKERLGALGQKSINNIVDATNYVMFDLGQPLHAFDAGKLGVGDGKWNISVRLPRKEDRSITTLDGGTHALSQDLLITDGVTGTLLGIAGVKGGKVAEVNEETNDIVLEAANFDPISVRNSSRTLKLRTDASARFENEPPQELTVRALDAVSRLIIEMAGGKIEGGVDIWPKKPKPAQVDVTLDEISGLLGSSIKKSEIENILTRFGWEYTHRRGNFTVTIPFERLDLRIKEDMIEEIGRVYGYENIPAQSLPPFKGKIEINKRFYYAEKIRRFLGERGFSEVCTYTLRDRGEVELANPLAADKSFMRADIAEGLQRALELNVRNAPLLGLAWVQVFEMGTVFRSGGEHASLAIGAAAAGDVKHATRGAAEKLNDAKNALLTEMGGTVEFEQKGNVIECNLDKLIESLPQPKSYDTEHTIYRTSGEAVYKPISSFPFALRDIAVWTPVETKPEDVLEVIGKEANDLLANHSLFDTFKKDDRVSYAFHLVFQSREKTLSDVELGDVMERISRAIEERGWEVR
jgi:phenylalanyl-tRNA synthetase beta chain